MSSDRGVTRRDFHRQAGIALAAGALGAACSSKGSSAPAPPQPAPAPAAAKRDAGQRILVLGGTGFVGPAVVEAAQARGHTLTLFNRGRTNPGLFPDVEKLHGDRDGALQALEGASGTRWSTRPATCRAS